MLQSSPLLACVRKLQVGGENTFGKQVLSLFLGIASKQPFCSLPSLAIHLIYFLGRFYIAKWAVREWWKKTLLINFESCFKPFMDCIL